MTFSESIPIAKQLAENQLKKGFDVEAFLILCAVSNKCTCDVEDLVPGTEIDEGIKNLLSLFIVYFNNRTTDNLTVLLDTLRQIISELYHTCETKDEMFTIQKFVADIATIL